MKVLSLRQSVQDISERVSIKYDTLKKSFSLKFKNLSKAKTEV